jgi:hypothetical protein
VGSWYYTYPEFVRDWTVAEAQKEYRGFDFAHSKEEPGYLRTPFWRFFHEVRELAFPRQTDRYRKVLWTNLVKFVARDRTSITEWPFGKAEPVIQLQEHVLKTELRIAAPDVCIFVTGPHLDCLLSRYFPALEFRRLDLPKRKFARLLHPQLPRNSYRTYHPNHVSRKPSLRAAVFRMLRRELGWSNT